MHRRLQSGLRENPESRRRYGSCSVISDLTNQSGKRVQKGTELPVGALDRADIGSVGIERPAPPHGGTGEGAGPLRTDSVGAPNTPLQSAPHVFEPLLRSNDAARLLGNIHVKTLQRYARNQRIPGNQIGGHWYFRASELDSWLRSRINLACHPCRLSKEAE